MIPRYRTIKLKNAINSTVTRHNADFTKETLEKFRKGKHMYNLSFTALVYHQQQEREYQQSVTIQFLSDLKKGQITKEMIEEIVEAYYAKLDYPDLIELLTYLLQELDQNKKVENMNLLDTKCSIKHKNPYIRGYPIEDFDPDDPLFKDRRVPIALQWGLEPLLKSRLIEKRILTSSCIDEFFTRDGKTEYTMERIIEFFRECVKIASIYFYDQTGKVLITKYTPKECLVKLEANTQVKNEATMVCLITNKHLEQITDSNVKRSVAMTDKLNIFNHNKAFEDQDFELFENVLGLALSFDSDGDTSFVEYDTDKRIKHSKSPVIVFEDYPIEGNLENII